MTKVIDFYTRKEVSNTPHSKQEGEDLIAAILQYELSLPTNCFQSSQLIDDTIRVIENATGASRYEVIDKVYGTKQA